jgi:hypothetical protein
MSVHLLSLSPPLEIRDVQTFIIGYDLTHKREESYENLISAIKSIARGTSWHQLDSTRVIRTDLSSSEVLWTLEQHLKSGDKLLVVAATTDFSASGPFGNGYAVLDKLLHAVD